MTAIAADSFPFNTARPGVTAGAPNTLLRLEGVAVMLGAGFGYQLIHGGWPMFALLFLVPDLSMLGYFAGKRIGVRSYSQTTGMWLRGVLEDQHGVKPQAIAWTTFEGAHVQECTDPTWVRRAAPGEDMMALLRGGELDAVIVGNDAPDGDDLRPVFPDAKAAGEAFFTRNGFVPVNHLLTMRQDLAAQEPETVAELLLLFRAVKASHPAEARDLRPMGREAIDPSLDLAIRYCVSQGLLRRPLSLDEVWRI